MAKRPTKPPSLRSWADYHLKGTPAKLVGIIDNVPDEKAKVGRPITVKNGHRLDVRLPADLMRRVEAYAAGNKADRSAVVRELLERGLKGEV